MIGQQSETTSNSLEPAWDPSNCVVNIRRTVNRDDQFVYICRDVVKVPLDQEARTDQRQAYALQAQSLAQTPKVPIEERFATRQHHPLDAQPPNGFDVPIELFQGQLTSIGVRSPDVAHHAPAIARGVNIQGEYWERFDAVRQSRGEAARCFEHVGHDAGISSPGSAGARCLARLAIHRASNRGAPSTITPAALRHRNTRRNSTSP